jgi:uncharacterized protein (TIGR04255 family)
MSHTASSGAMSPHFRNPPVVEVIFAVALLPLATSVVDLARFGIEQLGEEFPLYQDQPPTRMAVETFDDAVQNLAPTLALLTGAPPVRLWFQSEDKTRLVQVQRDWLAYNWQVGSGDIPYPRYERIEDEFLRIWDKFSDFIKQYHNQTTTVQHCELSYINHITPDGLWEHLGQLPRVLRLAGTADEFLPEPEDGQISFRYKIPYGGRDAGRLYIHSIPGQQSFDRKPIIQLTLTARGGPLKGGREGMLEFFQVAHEWITKGFAAVTTEEAQKMLWGRII